MKNIYSLIVVASIFLSGCAHNIQINPSTASLTPSNNKVDTTVGYHIASNDQNLKVKTPGGGGDDITYMPYKDTESALFTVLSHKFENVYKIKSLNDEKFIQDNQVKYVFIPTITTDSSSSSLFTWPPTSFSINMKIKAVNTSGDIVWSESVEGEGNAEFEEFTSDFGLAAKRATEQAFLKLAEKLENADLPQTK